MSSLINVKRQGVRPPHRYRLLVCICLVVSLTLDSKSVVGQEQTQTVEWTFLKEVDNVRFFYAQTQCESQPFLLIKVENMGASQVFGNWILKVTADGVTNSYVGLLLDMRPMASREGSCSLPDPHLAIPQIKASTQLDLSLEVQITKP